MMLTVLFLSAQLLMATPVMTEEFEIRFKEVQHTLAVPTIEISGEPVEGNVVTITCSAVAPTGSSPPKLKWNLQHDSRNQMEENGSGNFTAKIQENITLSDKHDGLNITCSASYPTVTAEKTVTLNVSYTPKDAMVVISPTDPVSVGSVVSLTCSCRGNPPAEYFAWFRISDGRLELISTEPQVYSFNVTSGDRGRLFYCWCAYSGVWIYSAGRQLTFEGDQAVGVQVTVKILGIMMLVSTLAIFECWFRARRSTKPVKDTVEADYVNRVIELQAS